MTPTTQQLFGMPETSKRPSFEIQTASAEHLPVIPRNGNGKKASTPVAKPDAAPPVLAPHSVEMEEAVLGAVLMEGVGVFRRIAWLTSDAFFIVRHGWIWDAIRRVADSDGVIDERTVAEALKARGQLEDIGGPAYLAYLISNTPTALYADVYAAIVQRAAVRRLLLDAAGEIARLAHSEDMDLDGVIAEARQTLDRVCRQHRADGGFEASSIESDRLMDSFGLGVDSKVPFGISGLDMLLGGGLQGGQLMYVGGRPGMRKSHLLLYMAMQVAERGQGVAFITLEMKPRDHIYRLLAMKTGIPLKEIEVTHVTGEGQRRAEIYEAMAWARNLPIYWSETARTPDKLRTELDALTRRESIALVLGDHQNLMRSGDAHVDRNDYARATYVTRQMKEINNLTSLPFVWAVQLGRAVEDRNDKRPLLSDFRDTGATEEDADVVLMLYRDDYYNETSQTPGVLNLLVRKNRQGELGSVDMRVEAPTFRLTEIGLTTYNLNKLVWGDAK